MLLLSVGSTHEFTTHVIIMAIPLNFNHWTTSWELSEELVLISSNDMILDLSYDWNSGQFEEFINKDVGGWTIP